MPHDSVDESQWISIKVRNVLIFNNDKRIENGTGGKAQK